MTEDDPNYERIAKEATLLSSTLRGAVLNRVAHLEIVIDTFLACHFCKTDREWKDFLTFIMPSNIIIFENKRNILKKIIENYYPALKEKVPNFHAILGKIRERRNEFAHYPLDVTPEGIKMYIESGNDILLDNMKERKQYTPKSMTDLANEIQNLANEISDHIPK